VLKKQIVLIIISCLAQWQALAADKLYTVFSLGYSDVEYVDESNEGVGYKIAFGYQFDPQWYVEAGYQQLIHDNLYVGKLPSAQKVSNGQEVQQGDALFVSFLGKASGPAGELFYRLGVMKTDIRGQQLLAGERECAVGKTNVFVIESFGAATLCDYDQGGLAGVFGLGFDYFIGARTMIRTEIEYIKGQDDLTVTAFNLGLRYNF
jgi:hypothetical protein